MKHFEDPRIQALAKPVAAGIVLTCVLGYSIYQLVFHNFFHGAMRVIPVICAAVLLICLWVVCGSAIWQQLHGKATPEKAGAELDLLTRAAHLDQPEPEEDTVPQEEPAEPLAVCTAPPQPWQCDSGKAAAEQLLAQPSEMDDKVRKAQEKSQKHLQAQARKREAEQARRNAKGQKLVQDAKHLQEKRLQEMEQPANWKPSQSKKR